MYNRFYFLVPLRIIIRNNYYVTDVHAHCSINCEVIKVYTVTYNIIVEPLYNGHLWGTMFWPLYRGGLC